MATAPPSPNDLTRQQLDELDALLQKMLSVPMSPVETPPPAATLPPIAQPPLPPWRADPPAPAPSLAHLPIGEPPAPKFEPPPAQPVPAPVPPAAKAPKPPPVPAPKPAAAPTVIAPKVAPPPVPKPVAVPPAPVALTPAPDVPPVPLVAIPFVALNGLFDSACGLFGPPGRLFRSGFVKNLYGLAGLGLVAYTGLHVAHVQGWLTLPVPLPWPK